MIALRFLFSALGFCLRVLLFVVTFTLTAAAILLSGGTVTCPKRVATRRRR